MVVTNIHCENCGYEWRPRGKPKRCPSCQAMLGETKARKWKRAEKKLAELLALRNWRLEPTGGQKIIDVHAKRAGRKLFIDVKSGHSYLIRRSQLEGLLKYHGKTSDVGFACEMDGKFYLFMLEDIL